MPQVHRAVRARQRLYNILDLGPGAGGPAAVVNGLLIALIVATLIATVLELVPRFAFAWRNIFEIIEVVALATFSMEYAARIWTAVEHPPWRRFGPVWSRLHFMASPAGLVDLAAVLPFWLSFFIAADFRVFLVLRLIRFFKLTRYSPAMRSLLEALYAERRALVGCFVILCGATLMAAALMHLAEGADAAGEVRHHTGCDVVGDRHPWHDRLWRCSAGYGGGPPDSGVDHLRRSSDGGVAGRYRRDRLRQRGAPTGLCRDLGTGRPDSVVQRAQRHPDRRCDEDSARAEGGQGNHDCKARRAGSFDVSDRRWERWKSDCTTSTSTLAPAISSERSPR